MKKKKSFRDIRNAVVMLCIMLAMLSTATFAWFSMNNQVEASGMAVKAQSAGSLIISDDVPDEDTITTEVEFTDAAEDLVPVTHDSTYATYASGLKKLKNDTSKKIEAGTGLIKDGESYEYEEADTEDEHYVDYVVYIATAGAEALKEQDLKVEISTDATFKDDGSTDTLKAASIDFYLNTVTASNQDATFSTGTYKGTLNLAGLDAAKNDASTTMTEVLLIENGEIPLNSGDDKLQITMRIYFDGALEKTDDTQAFVYSNKINTEDLNISAIFTAAQHVTS